MTQRPRRNEDTTGKRSSQHSLDRVAYSQHFARALQSLRRFP